MNDHKGFIRFLGLFPGNKVPDAKTIWLYCEYMTKADVIEQQFIDNCIELWSNGIITHTGTIIDVTFVDALCHRNSREENQTFIQQNIHSIFTFFYARYICFVVIRKDINADIIVFLGISPLFFEKSTLRFPD